MLDLSGYLGFFPDGDWSEVTPWLNMKAGKFTHEEPLHQYTMDKNLSRLVGLLIRREVVKITRLDRQKIVQKLIDYYRIHIENFGGLNTHAILKEVLEG